MGLIDHRTLIDRLHDTNGGTCFIGIEANAPATITMVVSGPEHTVELRLNEGEAGAIFDALGGALRALAVTPETPAAIASMEQQALTDPRPTALNVSDEQERQRIELGYTLEHDRGHVRELLNAALVYLTKPAPEVQFAWPWPNGAKRKSVERDLERGAALVLAAFLSLDEAVRASDA